MTNCVLVFLSLPVRLAGETRNRHEVLKKMIETGKRIDSLSCPDIRQEEKRKREVTHP